MNEKSTNVEFEYQETIVNRDSTKTEVTFRETDDDVINDSYVGNYVEYGTNDGDEFYTEWGPTKYNAFDDITKYDFDNYRIKFGDEFNIFNTPYEWLSRYDRY